MNPIISLGLAVCEKMEFMDKESRGIAMRFCKIYSPEKIGRIIEKAHQYSWWQTNPKAAFMKAVGEINKTEPRKEK